MEDLKLAQCKSADAACKNDRVRNDSVRENDEENSTK